MDPPLVTVNVLSHNRREALAGSLRTMGSALEYPRLEYVVVDNDSTDGTREMLRRDFPHVRLIENENVGAPGWTRGFEAGRGDWFLILDDDCYLEGDALDRALEAASAEDADLVSFRVVSSYDRDFEFNRHYPVGVLSFWGCAALVSRRALDRLGGYDPNIFIWANELEFTIRLLDEGFRHLFMPEVTAVHMKEPPPARQPAPAYRTHMRHLAYTAVKLMRPADAALVLANVAAKMVLGLPRDPARRHALPALVSGARLGRRARSPVRAPVSRFYRRNLRDFVSPLFYLRGNRHEDFYASRPDLYPSGRATLSL